MALADAHRALPAGARLGFELSAGGDPPPEDAVPGGQLHCWDPEELRDLLEGAGFAVDRLEVTERGDDPPRLRAEATRLRTLPDTVGPGMRLLVCGLNPSLVAADAGVGFAGPTNRFWKALRLAGLSEVDRDARLLLRRDGIGMTDQVKRATRAASELTTADYRSGLARLQRLVARTEPAALCVVGLAGWRASIDRSARPGWQPDAGWAAPVYVMPSTSGLNAGTSLDELATHLGSAALGR
jgi:TDG/mug DNA glycosylase family protein